MSSVEKQWKKGLNRGRTEGIQNNPLNVPFFAN